VNGVILKLIDDDDDDDDNNNNNNMQRMRTTLLSMRIIGGCPGTSWLGLQTAFKQNNQASRTE